MDRGQLILVECALESGAFSGERVFRLKLADGKIEYSGVAPVHYCFTHTKQPLGPDQPPRDQPIKGLIVALLITNGGDQATVELPDGEAVPINISQVAYRLAQSRESDYVPLGS